MGIRAGLGPRLGGGIREQSEIGLGASVVGVGWGREARRKGLDFGWGRKGRRGGDATNGGKERESKVEDEQERERNFLFFFGCCKFGVGPSVLPCGWVLGVRIFGSSDTYSYVLS